MKKWIVFIILLIVIIILLDIKWDKYCKQLNNDSIETIRSLCSEDFTKLNILSKNDDGKIIKTIIVKEIILQQFKNILCNKININCERAYNRFDWEHFVTIKHENKYYTILINSHYYGDGKVSIVNITFFSNPHFNILNEFEKLNLKCGEFIDKIKSGYGLIDRCNYIRNDNLYDFINKNIISKELIN